MPLLQISEPGLQQAPHQHKLAAGIDLGTTHSLVATVRSGMVDVLASVDGAILLPSIVYYGNDQTHIGLAALPYAITDPSNTLISFKRFMGRSAADIRFMHPYQLHGDLDQSIQFQTAQGIKSPIEASALILRELKARAEQTLGGELGGVVITVPAYFDEAQRQATKDAAALAQLNVLRIINEPTAAAIAYGISPDTHPDTHQLIFDLGGGTFDVSILKLNEGVFEVVATGGNTALGGDDFDRAIADWVAQQMPTSITSNDYSHLQLLAKTAKEQLSDSAQTTLIWQNQSFTLDQTSFWQLTQPLVAQCLHICQRVLRDAKLTIPHVDNLITVGGATRMPHIQQALAQLFTRPLQCEKNPDHVVALGAALLADQLIGNKHDSHLLVDVTPLSIGIETMGGLVEKIIPRNSTIPCSKSQEFTTYQDGQTAMKIHVLQGERELVSECRSLGEFTLSGIPPLVAGAARIRVDFIMDADGLLTVHALETTQNIQNQVVIKPSYGLSEQDAERILRESHQYAQHDLELRKLQELRVDAAREINALGGALKVDALLLKSSEAQTLQSLVKQLESALAENSLNYTELKTQLAKLKKHSDAFAALRMNHAIQHALAGTNVQHWSKPK